jgi:hypothetical protein
MVSCVTFGLMAIAVVPMLILVNSTPDQIPADVLAKEEAEQQQADDYDASREKNEGVVNVRAL